MHTLGEESQINNRSSHLRNLESGEQNKPKARQENDKHKAEINETENSNTDKN